MTFRIRCPASIFEGIALRRFARGVAIHRGEREGGGRSDRFRVWTYSIVERPRQKER